MVHWYSEWFPYISTTPDGLMHLQRPVHLWSTEDHLSRPVTYPLTPFNLWISLNTFKTVTWCIKSNKDQKLTQKYTNGNLSLTSLERLITSLMLLSMMSSTCTSHFSTAPRASDVEISWMSSTRSPSLLYMAWMSKLGRKSSLAMPSKHFFKWGCTRIGSLVSERISSISSFDRKKNLQSVKRKYW